MKKIYILALHIGYWFLLIILFVFLLSNCTTVQSSDNKENSEAPTQEELKDTAKWKIIKVVPEYEDHVTEEDKLDYQDHLDFMVESGYIQFLTDSTFVGNNGIIEMDGTYEIVGDSLKTKNSYGFQSNYVLVEFSDTRLIYKSVQEDLTITLYHKRVK